MIQKIISGGQTGCDRAALDAGLFLGYEIGGYVPKGRMSEDGPVPAKYPMMELSSPDYKERTKRNIAAAGATVILLQHGRDLRGGTHLTLKECERTCEKNDQCFILLLMSHRDAASMFRAFWKSLLIEGETSIVNVAGPRESKSPGIYRVAYEFLVTNIPAVPKT